MKADESDHNWYQWRAVFYTSLGILVISFGLLCDERLRRYHGGRPPAVGFEAAGIRLQISADEGVLSWLGQWGLGAVSRAPFYFGARTHYSEYHWGMHFNAAGFGFGFLPRRVVDYDVSIAPHAGLSIPLWFFAAASFGVAVFALIRRNTAKLPAGGQEAPRRAFAFHGVESWAITCAFWFAAAEALWCLAGQFRRYDLLEIPMSVALFPPLLLLEGSESVFTGRAMPLFGAVFWTGLFFTGLLLSRRQINPAVPVAIILGVVALGALLVVLVAT